MDSADFAAMVLFDVADQLHARGVHTNFTPSKKTLMLTRGGTRLYMSIADDLNAVHVLHTMLGSVCRTSFYLHQPDYAESIVRYALKLTRR